MLAAADSSLFMSLYFGCSCGNLYNLVNFHVKCDRKLLVAVAELAVNDANLDIKTIS